jgi:hypothetical protein
MVLNAHFARGFGATHELSGLSIVSFRKDVWNNEVAISLIENNGNMALTVHMLVVDYYLRMTLL